MSYDLGYALEEEAEFQGNINRISGALCLKGEPVFYDDSVGAATEPGQIYSKAGVDEFYISGICEFHFDEMFKEEE